MESAQNYTIESVKAGVQLVMKSVHETRQIQFLRATCWIKGPGIIGRRMAVWTDRALSGKKTMKRYQSTIVDATDVRVDWRSVRGCGQVLRPSVPYSLFPNL